MIRFAISIPLALFFLALILLLMAQLIQPNSAAKPLIDNIIEIDFLRVPSLSTHPKKTFSPPKEETIPKEKAPQPAPPASKALLLPKNAPSFKMDNIRLPKAKFSAPTSLHDLVYEAKPKQSMEAVKQSSPQLPRALNPQFTESLFPIHTPNPIYPRRAKKRGIEGWVKVSFTIQINGKVENIVVLDSEPAGIFDNASRLTVSKWKFKPQLFAGKPTARKVEKTIRFNLQQ